MGLTILMMLWISQGPDKGKMVSMLQGYQTMQQCNDAIPHVTKSYEEMFKQHVKAKCGEL